MDIAVQQGNACVIRTLRSGDLSGPALLALRTTRCLRIGLIASSKIRSLKSGSRYRAPSSVGSGLTRDIVALLEAEDLGLARVV